jgi:hypothetical protein
MFDLIGRCLMESHKSDWTMALTLTYDDKKITNPLQTKIVTVEDFQKFQRRLRRHWQFKYLAAGEYGERKGRTHFHVLLMGQGIPPEIPNKKNYVSWKHWPWGYVYADHGTSEAKIRYIVKYLVKAKEQERKKKRDKTQHLSEWIGYSKRPILGEQMVRQFAERQAEMQVFPRNFNYMPPNAHPSKWRYTLQGKAQEVYFDRLFELWPEGINARKTEWMENAYRRYNLKKIKDAFENLPISEQIKFYSETHAPRSMAGVVLTSEEIAEIDEFQERRARWTLYKEQNRQEMEAEAKATKKWLADQEKVKEHK